MCTNDPPPLEPAENASWPLPDTGRERVVERIPYDVGFTDELIRRCRARAIQGYRLAATAVATNKTDILLIFEEFEWNGVPFPPTAGEGRELNENGADEDAGPPV